LGDGRIVQVFRERVESELRGNILPFWLKHTIDEEFGGFRGRISNALEIDPLAEKGLILNARILWTFSHAYRILGERDFLRAAERANEYLMAHFWDREYQGFFWMVDCHGLPLDTKKKTYGQAFGVYALVEHFLATGNKESLLRARQLYELILKSSYDVSRGGYFETYERDWSLARDQRLSEVDLDEKKSMNTHLHMLEASSALFLASRDGAVRERLRELVHLFLDHIVDPGSFHFRMFFDEDWQPKSDHISFGHDIEGSWLLCEAADLLDDRPLIARTNETAVKMAAAVLNQAVDTDSGLLYEAGPAGIIDDDKHWWPQAEAVVGFLNAHQLSGENRFLEASWNCWQFIENRIIDRKCGEWFWKVSRTGVPSGDRFKVDPWKCPYHNSRTCFETMARLDKIAVNISS
jgi:mannobiose 2-epimerase